MRFTVVMPLFNKAPHVEAAISSALNQSLAPAQIIVIDDGSTDGSLELVRLIDDPRLTVLTRSPPGPGGYAARNLGIEAAQADWVAFLDADDIWHEGHLRGLADAIAAAGPEIGCAFSGAELVFSDRRTARAMSTRFLAPCVRLGIREMLRAWLESTECPLWTSAVAVRRDLLIDAGLFPADRTRRGGDKDLWLRVMWRTAVVYSGKVTAEFHQDAVNRMSNSTPHSEPPILAETVSRLLPAAPAELRPLLKRLSNMEVVGYARYSAGRGQHVLLRFAPLLYLPVGLLAFAKLAAYGAAGIIRRRRPPPRPSGH
ncbi:MAG: glycosyltransferase family A protein [Sphingomicrobium sp.]